MDECARVMRDCLQRALSEGWQPDEIRFVLFGEAARSNFEQSFNAVER
jgi:hypothetical protein